MSETKIRVLHDWDNSFISRKWCLRRGIQLLLYVASNKIQFLRRLKIVKEVYMELYRYAETIAKLDRLVGVSAVIGIYTQRVKPQFPKAEEELEKFGAEIYDHWHVDDVTTVFRVWKPPLSQSKKTWHYDMETVASRMPMLKTDELPIWHIDYPYLISDYIDWLYKVKIEGMKIYN